MKRRCFSPHTTAIRYAFVAAVVAGCLFGNRPVRADIDVRIDIGNAPPAPRFVFHARPHERYFPGERIYVVDDPGVGDNDVFRYGGYYWVFSDGYWYRSSGWRGRFRVVDPRYVPAVFYRLPPTHWKHHPSGPPGLMRRGGGPPGHMQQGGGNPRGQEVGRPEGHGKQDGGPPGQAKKGAKGDKRGDKGNK